MVVDSYLELFTTLFGWQFYGVLWGVLRDTGIVFLPFLGIVIDNFVEGFRGGDFGRREALSLRQMETDIIIALFVVVLAGEPFASTPLNASVMKYNPPPTLTDSTPPQATVADPQSTFGVTSFTGAPSTVNVPLWWYTVMALSTAVNQAIIEGLPDAPDLRAYAQQARLATIEDVALRQEVADFFSQCFMPARARYQAERPDDALTRALLDTWGNDDPDWLGSHVYREMPGYYAGMRPDKQIPGWPFDPSRDIEYDPAGPAPAWGHPTCKEWWENTAGPPGLRARLVSDPGASGLGAWWDGAYAWLGGLASGTATEKKADALARAVLERAPPAFTNDDFTPAANDAGKGLASLAVDKASAAAGAAGLAWYAALFAVVMDVVVPALPMIQAVVLLGIYALLPLLVVLSRYSLQMLVTGALLIFTVKFWSALWYLAQWVDVNLISAMYPDMNVFTAQFSSGAPDHLGKRMALDMITSALYLGLPLLWTGIMAIAGVQMGRAIGSTAGDIGNSLQKPIDSAGNRGSSVAGAAGSGVIQRMKR
ncbi:MAG TPA: conjugal transfer protein TraG [Thiotrichales bacterium]|nr:conjugal transfer protein TraG [Thiotrichales bacterium]